MCDRSASPSMQEVWRQGFYAGLEGRELKTCPYTVRDGIPAVNTWIAGWRYGHAQRSPVQNDQLRPRPEPFPVTGERNKEAL